MFITAFFCSISRSWVHVSSNSIIETRTRITTIIRSRRQKFIIRSRGQKYLLLPRFFNGYTMGSKFQWNHILILINFLNRIIVSDESEAFFFTSDQLESKNFQFCWKKKFFYNFNMEIIQNYSSLYFFFPASEAL